MKRPVGYGLDFGTSNSAISVAYPDESVLVPLGPLGADVLPSIVYLDATRQRLAGDQAVQQYLVAGARHTTRLLSSLKTFLADPTWTSTTAPWGDDVAPAQLVAIVLRELKRQADAYCGHDVRSAVLGHPVFFAGAEGEGWEDRQDLAKSRLEEAARIAGFEQLAFADEALAAVAQEHRVHGVLVGLDFGGGTFDVSVIDQNETDRKLLATHGAAIGGERFDSLLFDDVLAEPLGFNATYVHHGKRLIAPRHLLQMRTLYGILSMVGDLQTRRILDNFLSYEGGSRLEVVDEILYGGHGYAFFRTVEAAKIALSASEASSVTFARPGVRINEPVTRDQFTRLINADLDRIDAVVVRALQDAGVHPDSVKAVIRTGGSSQIPAFVSRMNRRFDPRTVKERDALATVALGLGLLAIEEFG